MRKKQNLLLRILIISFTTVFIAAFGLLLKEYAFQMGLFDDIHVELMGNQFVSQDRIMEEVIPFMNQTLLSLDLDDIKDGVSSLDFIESVQVSRILPGTLMIQILERKPILLITLDGQNMFMDKNGVLIPCEGHSISFFPVPIITISEEMELAIQNNMESIKELSNQVSKFFRFILDDYSIFYDNLSEVIISNDEWTFFCDSKTRIFITSDMLFTQLNVLKYFEKTVSPKRELGDYSYIDLRVAEQVVVKEKYREG